MPGNERLKRTKLSVNRSTSNKQKTITACDVMLVLIKTLQKNLEKIVSSFDWYNSVSHKTQLDPLYRRHKYDMSRRILTLTKKHKKVHTYFDFVNETKLFKRTQIYANLLVNYEGFRLIRRLPGPSKT